MLRAKVLVNNDQPKPQQLLKENTAAYRGVTTLYPVSASFQQRDRYSNVPDEDLINTGLLGLA